MRFRVGVVVSCFFSSQRHLIVHLHRDVLVHRRRPNVASSLVTPHYLSCFLTLFVLALGGGAASLQLGAVLDSIEVKKPRIPVVSNVDAEPHSDPAVIKDILKKQVRSDSNWYLVGNNKRLHVFRGDESVFFSSIWSSTSRRVACWVVVEHVR